MAEWGYLLKHLEEPRWMWMTASQFREAVIKAERDIYWMSSWSNLTDMAVYGRIVVRAEGHSLSVNFGWLQTCPLLGT
jgi:hypothetical protein